MSNYFNNCINNLWKNIILKFAFIKLFIKLIIINDLKDIGSSPIYILYTVAHCYKVEQRIVFDNANYKIGNIL